MSAAGDNAGLATCVGPYALDLTSLHPDVLAAILLTLPLHDVLALSCACRRLRDACADDSRVWLELCHARWGSATRVSAWLPPRPAWPHMHTPCTPTSAAAHEHGGTCKGRSGASVHAGASPPARTMSSPAGGVMQPASHAQRRRQQQPEGMPPGTQQQRQRQEQQQREKEHPQQQRQHQTQRQHHTQQQRRQHSGQVQGASPKPLGRSLPRVLRWSHSSRRTSSSSGAAGELMLVCL